jgi:hypothetical protein
MSHMEAKLKHLEFIQNIITRMATNSFLIKGWTITLISALFALAARDANTNYLLISYIPIPVFWLLDGFFLFQEYQYRELYKAVAAKADTDPIDFSLNASSYNDNTWLDKTFSKTLNLFYGMSILVTIVVMCIIIYR